MSDELTAFQEKYGVDPFKAIRDVNPESETHNMMRMPIISALHFFQDTESDEAAEEFVLLWVEYWKQQAAV